MATINHLPDTILSRILEDVIFDSLLFKAPDFDPENTYRISFRRCGRLSLVCQQWHRCCKDTFTQQGPEVMWHELTQTRDPAELNRLQNMRKLYHKKFRQPDMNDQQVLASWTEQMELLAWVDHLSEGLRLLGLERKRIQREWDVTRPGEIFLMDEYESASLLIRFIQS